jgi:hypothetical protein
MTLQNESTTPSTTWIDRLLTWGLIVVIPLIGVIGFGLLTNVKHSPPGTPMKGSERVVAAPEIAAGPPTVVLSRANAQPCTAESAGTAKDRSCGTSAATGRDAATIH